MKVIIRTRIPTRWENDEMFRKQICVKALIRESLRANYQIKKKIGKINVYLVYAIYACDDGNLNQSHKQEGSQKKSGENTI